MSRALAYRRLTAAMVPAWRRWWPLATQELRSLFRTKWGVALYFLCLSPSIGRLVMLLILFGVVDFGPGAMRGRGAHGPNELAQLDPGRVAFYVEPVLSTMPGMVFFLLLSSLVVARSIARDRSTNALELYWTRGIAPGAYLFAKWLGGFLLLSSMTVVMPVLLWVSAVFLGEDWRLLWDTGPGLFAGVCGLAAVTGVWTAVATLISAASASASMAMVAWSVLMVGSAAVGFVLANTLREPWLASSLSFWDAGGVVVRAIAGLPQHKASLPGSLAALAAVLAVTGFTARRRLTTEAAMA